MTKTIVLGCKRLALNKSIAGVGGTDKSTGVLNHYTEAEAIKAIDYGTINFEVHDASGHVAHVRVAHRGEHRFLETYRDQVKTDNLENLPICSHALVSFSQTSRPIYRPARPQSGHCVSSSFLDVVR